MQSKFVGRFARASSSIIDSRVPIPRRSKRAISARCRFNPLADCRAILAPETRTRAMSHLFALKDVGAVYVAACVSRLDCHSNHDHAKRG